MRESIKKMLVVIDPFIREFRECCEKYLKGNVLEHYLFLKAAILNKINGTSGPPLPHFSEAKMARFCSFAPSSFLGGWVGGGGMGDNCSILFCPRL